LASSPEEWGDLPESEEWEVVSFIGNGAGVPASSEESRPTREPNAFSPDAFNEFEAESLSVFRSGFW
jgi:hypothetical protein